MLESVPNNPEIGKTIMHSKMLAIVGELAFVLTAIAPWLVVPASMVALAGALHGADVFAILLFVVCMSVATWMFVPTRGAPKMRGMDIALSIVFFLALLLVAGGIQWAMTDSRGQQVCIFTGWALLFAILGRLTNENKILKAIRLVIAICFFIFSGWIFFFAPPTGQSSAFTPTNVFMKGMGGGFGLFIFLLPILVAMKRECAHIRRIFWGNVFPVLLGGGFWAMSDFRGWPMLILWVPALLWVATLIWACIGKRKSLPYSATLEGAKA